NDLNGDGVPELVVSAIERTKSSSPSPGRVYIFDGMSVRNLSLGSSHPGSGFSSSQMQTLIAPSIVPDGGWFGYVLYALPDMGGTDYGTPQGRNDIAVHSEAGDFIDANNHLVQGEGGGALFAYMSWDPSDPMPRPAGQPFVKAVPVTLQTPIIKLPFVP